MISWKLRALSIGAILLILSLLVLYAPYQTWPAILALLLVLSTKNAALGLALGGFSGSLLLCDGAVGPAVRIFVEVHFFGALSGNWHVAALLFTLLLGSFAALIELSGGFQNLISCISSKPESSLKKLQLATLGTGCLCFFDGLANAVLLGRLYRPLYDRFAISRDKLAYLVDTTSSAVACIAFVSTWIATQLTLIKESTSNIDGAPRAYELFLGSIPYCFYCTTSLVLALGVITWNWNPGLMAASEALTKKAPKSNPSSPESRTGESRAWRALLPIGGLVISILATFYLWETSPLLPITTSKVQNAFSGSAGPYALTIGAFVGCMIAWICLPRTKRREGGSTAAKGAAGMLSPLLILILAWTFGSVLKVLGTAELLAQLLGSSTSVYWLPAAIFLAASVTSFLTGSSWGTMSLFMPIALPVFLSLAADLPFTEKWDLAPAIIGAVFGGAVFGDHCSPFSDTTIVSAVAAGTSPTSHIRTQLPYAITAAVISIGVGYSLVALGVSIAIILPLCLILSLGVPFVGSRVAPKR